MTCRACGLEQNITPRDDRTLLRSSQQKEISESERLELLRRQDGKPLPVPAELAGLFEGMDIAPWKSDEALTIWNDLRREVGRSSAFEASQKFVFLTRALAIFLFRKGEDLRRRALFESALEALSLPRYRQVMRGLLSRSAARERDFASAETWLAPCDERAQDIESDSEWRLSRAVLDSMLGNWERVLAVLGPDRNTIPILDDMDAYATVLRANALENLGRMDEAVRLLQQEMTRGPAVRLQLRNVIELNPQMNLCPRSFRAAEAAVEQQLAKLMKRLMGVGWANYFLLLTGVVLAGLALVIVVRAIQGKSHSDLFALIGLVPGSLITMGLGISGIRQAKDTEIMMTRGIRGRGTIVAIEDTGVRINKVPRLKITLQVRVEGSEPFLSGTRMLQTVLVSTGINVGSMVMVRVHPEKKSECLVELV